MPPKINHRDVSPFLQAVRAFLLGVTINFRLNYSFLFLHNHFSVNSWKFFINSIPASTNKCFEI